jgi:hypothetical protein
MNTGLPSPYITRDLYSMNYVGSNADNSRFYHGRICPFGLNGLKIHNLEINEIMILICEV